MRPLAVVQGRRYGCASEFFLAVNRNQTFATYPLRAAVNEYRSIVRE